MNRERKRVQRNYGTKTKVQQQFKDQSSIKNVLNRVQHGDIQRTGQVVYMDLYDAPSFHEAQNTVAEISQKFAMQPSKLRARFNNDPETMIAFCQDKKNDKEAIEIGLKRPKEPTPLEAEINKAKAINKAIKEDDKEFFEKKKRQAATPAE